MGNFLRIINNNCNCKIILTKKKKVKKKKWMTQEILDLMQTRRTGKTDAGEYNRLDRDIKGRCRIAKEGMNTMCTEIEHKINVEPAVTYRQIKDITGMRVCSGIF